MNTTLDIKTGITVICHKQQIAVIESMLHAIHGKELVKTAHSRVPGKPFFRMTFSVCKNYSIDPIDPLDPVEETQKTIARAMANSYRMEINNDYKEAVESISISRAIKKKFMAWILRD
ncbi:TPA: hypothetical protein I7120_21885 [Vibrio vulnificus]|nr:hypothetical protein [Vibrio vulnificus]